MSGLLASVCAPRKGTPRPQTLGSRPPRFAPAIRVCRRLDSRQLSEAVAASIRASYPSLSLPHCCTASEDNSRKPDSFILSPAHLQARCILGPARRRRPVHKLRARVREAKHRLPHASAPSLSRPAPASPPAVRARQQAAAFVVAHVRVGVADPGLCAPRVRISTVSSCSACGRGLLAVCGRAGGCA